MPKEIIVPESWKRFCIKPPLPLIDEFQIKCAALVGWEQSKDNLVIVSSYQQKKTMNRCYIMTPAAYKLVKAFIPENSIVDECTLDEAREDSHDGSFARLID